MKIAVFGGAGMVGQALLPRLAEAGHSLRALQRTTALPDCGAESLQGDMTDAELVRDVIADSEIVLQMTKGGRSTDQPVKTSTHATINVCDAIRASETVVQYVLVSSDAAVGIWSHPHPEPISGAVPPMSYPGYYSLGKVLEEVIASEYRRNHDLPVTVTRLSWVHTADTVLRQFVCNRDPDHPGRGPFSSEYPPELKARAQAGEQFVVMPVAGDGKPLGRTLVHLDDVCTGLEAVLGNTRAVGCTFHISGPGFLYDRPCTFLAEKMDLPLERVVLHNAYPFTIDLTREKSILGWQPGYDIIRMLSEAWG